LEKADLAAELVLEVNKNPAATSHGIQDFRSAGRAADKVVSAVQAASRES
jgi:hypothetical protein